MQEDKELIRFQVNRNVKNLFKRYLEIIERVADQHDIAMGKLVDVLPVEYKPLVKLADHFDEEVEQLIRKEILSAGNDAIRAIENELALYDISLKKS